MTINGVRALKQYDVLVVGGGHAGCEAALTAARLGASTLLLTLNMDHIAQMSCNPAIGGVGKGQLVREIDALGGAQAMVTDAAAIQFRMLNQTKGPAVQSPRSQCDKVVYQRGMKCLLENTPNLDILQGEAVSFVVEAGQVAGVVTMVGDVIAAKTVILNTGTFLSGKLHYGLRNFSGGRAGDPASSELSQALAGQLGLKLGRLKTGTPPRVLAKTIDFSAMSLQHSEPAEEEFSFWSRELRPVLPSPARRAMPCYGVYSNEETAEIVRANLDQAPLYQGIIKGVGARYCPSFEDKVVRFAHHPRHLLYLEPEGAETGEYYINGISTSLPPEVQRRMLSTLPGFENAVISRYAYAIEYDFLPPEQLTRTLALKRYPNLFSAGQINGTSGYEEAAGQGLVAGLNAARYAAGLEPVEMARDQSYIGVMIDDLVTKEIVEPYRLFTSRAEYRLHLRQDNADLRLCEWARLLGLLPEAKYREFAAYRDQLDLLRTATKDRRIGPKTLFELLKGNPDAPFPADEDVPLPFDRALLPELDNSPSGRRAWRELVIEAHYDGYLQREAQSISKLHKLESWRIPDDFDYHAIKGLCNESRQKLLKVAPRTLAQAGRIDGVSPAEIALLQVHLTRQAHRQPKTEDAVTP